MGRKSKSSISSIISIDTKQIINECISNNIEYIKNVSNNNIKILYDCLDNTYNTLLHIASNLGYIDILKYLLSEKCTIINSLNIELRSPLHLACLNGHFACAKLLIKNGASIDILDKNNLFPYDLTINSMPINLKEFISSNEIAYDYLIYSMGNSCNYQLGYLTETKVISIPKPISTLNGLNIERVSLGFNDVYAFNKQNEIFSWGIFNPTTELSASKHSLKFNDIESAEQTNKLFYCLDNALILDENLNSIALSNSKRSSAVSDKKLKPKYINILPKKLQINNFSEFYSASSSKVFSTLYSSSFDLYYWRANEEIFTKNFKSFAIKEVISSDSRIFLLTSDGAIFVIGDSVEDLHITNMNPQLLLSFKDISVSQFTCVSCGIVCLSKSGQVYQQLFGSRNITKISFYNYNVLLADDLRIIKISSCENGSIAISSLGKLYIWNMEGKPLQLYEFPNNNENEFDKLGFIKKVSSIKTLPKNSAKSILFLNGLFIVDAIICQDELYIVNKDGLVFNFSFTDKNVPLKRVRLNQVHKLFGNSNTTIFKVGVRKYLPYESLNEEIEEFPSLLRLCEESLASNISPSTLVAAFQFVYNINVPHLCEWLGYYIALNIQFYIDELLKLNDLELENFEYIFKGKINIETVELKELKDNKIEYIPSHSKIESPHDAMVAIINKLEAINLIEQKKRSGDDIDSDERYLLLEKRVLINSVEDLMLLNPELTELYFNHLSQIKKYTPVFSAVSQDNNPSPLVTSNSPISIKSSPVVSSEKSIAILTPSILPKSMKSSPWNPISSNFNQTSIKSTIDLENLSPVIKNNSHQFSSNSLISSKSANSFSILEILSSTKKKKGKIETPPPIVNVWNPNKNHIVLSQSFTEILSEEKVKFEELKSKGIEWESKISNNLNGQHEKNWNPRLVSKARLSDAFIEDSVISDHNIAVRLQQQEIDDAIRVSNSVQKKTDRKSRTKRTFENCKSV